MADVVCTPKTYTDRTRSPNHTLAEAEYIEVEIIELLDSLDGVAAKSRSAAVKEYNLIHTTHYCSLEEQQAIWTAALRSAEGGSPNELWLAHVASQEAEKPFKLAHEKLFELLKRLREIDGVWRTVTTTFDMLLGCSKSISIKPEIPHF